MKNFCFDISALIQKISLNEIGYDTKNMFHMKKVVTEAKKSLLV